MFLYSIKRKYKFLPLLVLCLENWEIYLYAWTLLGEIENLRLNEIPDIWNGLFLNIQPLLRIFTVWNIHINVPTWILNPCSIWNLSLFKRVLWRPRMGRSHHVCMTTNVRDCFFQHYFLSPSGDLGIGLVWDNHPPHQTTTFRSDCWNPLQTELNHLWWVLSCS